MLKVRIIPVLLLKGNTIVKSVGFQDHRMIGDAITAVKVFSERKADELVILDIEASKSNINFELLKRLAKNAFLPLSLGGGVMNHDDVEKLFRIGADKVVVNSMFFEDIETLRNITQKFGSQAITLSLDLKLDEKNEYHAFYKSGLIKSKLTIQEIIERISYASVGEVMINSINNDGLMNGYDLNMLSLFNNDLRIPKIICGGCGSSTHMNEAFVAGVDAVAAGSIFHWVGESIITLKKFLLENDIPVRIN